MKHIEHIKNNTIQSLVKGLEKNFTDVLCEDNNNLLSFSCKGVKENVRLSNIEFKFHLKKNQILNEKIEMLYHPNPSKNKLVSESVPFVFLLKCVVEKVLYLQLDEKYIESVSVVKDAVAEDEEAKILEAVELANIKAKERRLTNVNSGGSIKSPTIDNMYLEVDFIIY